MNWIHWNGKTSVHHRIISRKRKDKSSEWEQTLVTLTSDKALDHTKNSYSSTTKDEQPNLKMTKDQTGLPRRYANDYQAQ